MFQIIPKSDVLTNIVQITTQLKWAWDYLLDQSFAHAGITLPEYVDNLTLSHYHDNSDCGDAAECAVCLCKIDEGVEVRELKCNHLFHRVCLDRWLGYGHVTCPLCRNNLKQPSFMADRHQEVIFVSFCSGRSRDRCTWWLR